MARPFDARCRSPITAEEVESLLDLERSPGGCGWVTIRDAEHLQVEISTGHDALVLRSFLVLPSTPPETATKLLFDPGQRLRWDHALEQFEEVSPASSSEQIVHLRTCPRFGIIPPCDVLHRRRMLRPCGDAHAAWVCRDADELPLSLVKVSLDMCFRLESAVLGHVVRCDKDGCRVFTYVQMEATPLVSFFGQRLAPDIIGGLCNTFSSACKEHGVAHKEGEFSEKGHFPTEFYDLTRDDETGSASPAASAEADALDQDKEMKRLSLGLDFLGAVDHKKLVPAVSAFRRMLKRSSRTAARRKENLAESSKVRHEHARPVPGEEEESTRRRRSSAREKSRERQRGSMEVVAERLGEVVRSRRTGRDSALAVVPEEDDVKTPDVKCEVHEKSDTKEVRKRFSLPLPARRKSGSVNGTDSEDSMSSAGVSDTSHSSRTRRSSGSGTAALDAIFERARASAVPEGSLSTTASSRGSSPRLTSGAIESPKPSLAGAAWVLMQLCKQEPSIEEAAETQVVATRHTSRSSLISTEAFKFCFPQDICGVPLEPKSTIKEPDRWKRGRRKRAA
ncbi:unnamed protein product [Durusdinium trenchii]|uniref:START domain-containing protein n=1 Tax=Durusdinium trenchii TaxID=1381693 RepID=A0ABP0IKN1_9DINO